MRGLVLQLSTQEALCCDVAEDRQQALGAAYLVVELARRHRQESPAAASWDVNEFTGFGGVASEDCLGVLADRLRAGRFEGDNVE